MRAVWLALAITVSSAPLPAADPPASIAAFARLPQLRSPALSPDGSKIVAIAGVSNLRTAIVIDRATQKVTPVLTSELNEFEVTWCDWANDTRILCGYRALNKASGQYYPVTRLVAVNADGSKQKVLLQNTLQGGRSQFQDQVLAWTPEDPQTVLVEASEDGDMFPEIYELDVYSGVMRLHSREREPFVSFYSDSRGEVRLARAYRGAVVTWHARATGSDSWSELSRYRVYRDAFLLPVGFGQEPSRFYALANHEGRAALWLVDLEDRREPDLVFSHPLVDVDGPITDVDGRLIGMHYETDTPFAHYTEPRAAAMIASVRQALPNQYVVIGDQTRDGRIGIVRAMSDIQSLTYYVYDQERASLKRLGSQYPELDKTRLAQMRPVSYKARDGTRIPAYLTAPPGVAANRIPLVVMPHGGPSARDSWGFDLMVQFLASRGYGVLQMNFRGSSGFGADWETAAHQDWGGLTYDDIIDGARWAIESGVADPQRVCIVGWSFGGYAAMLGAVRETDLFRCSAAIAGVSDLKVLLKEGRFFLGYEIRKAQLGRDESKFERDSPRRHAQNAKIPVLLVHGRRDPVVNDDHSKLMADALKREGKEVEYVWLEHADHNIDDVASRTILLEKLEAFLGRHLAGPAAEGTISGGINK